MASKESAFEWSGRPLGKCLSGHYRIYQTRWNGHVSNDHRRSFPKCNQRFPPQTTHLHSFLYHIATVVVFTYISIADQTIVSD